MRILFLGQHFTPENVSGAVLATQFTESLMHRGHQITFATCFPNYPMGIVFDGYKGKLFQHENLDGIDVMRVWSYTSPHKSFVRRYINYGSFSAFVLIAALAGKKPDIVVSYSPPLPLGITAYLVSRYFRVPWVLRLEDLFPDAAIRSGVFRNQVVISFFEGMEKFIYAKAKHISVISEGFRQRLLEKGVPDEKMTVIPVWADPDEVKPQPKETAFRKEFHLDDKFVLLYAGNLGYTSGLEDVLQAANLLRDQNDIHFMFIGEGTRKQDYIQFAEQLQLSNVTFAPFQPRERFSEMLASADVTLVTLNEQSAMTSLPGKTFSYLAAGRPILAVTPLTSELARLLCQFDCGIIIPSGNPEEIKRGILALKADNQRLDLLGKNSRETLEQYFAREYCVNQYEALFKQMIQGS